MHGPENKNKYLIFNAIKKNQHNSFLKKRKKLVQKFKKKHRIDRQRYSFSRGFVEEKYARRDYFFPCNGYDRIYVQGWDVLRSPCAKMKFSWKTTHHVCMPGIKITLNT